MVITLPLGVAVSVGSQPGWDHAHHTEVAGTLAVQLPHNGDRIPLPELLLRCGSSEFLDTSFRLLGLGLVVNDSRPRYRPGLGGQYPRGLIRSILGSSIRSSSVGRSLSPSCQPFS